MAKKPCEEGGEPVIRVHTRCGGGNRDDYKEVFAKMEAHPDFLFDEDDDFDSTYCDFVFKVPENFSEAVKHLYDTSDKRTPAEKWQVVIKGMQAANEPGPKDPLVEKAIEVGKGIAADLEKTIQEGGPKIILV